MAHQYFIAKPLILLSLVSLLLTSCVNSTETERVLVNDIDTQHRLVNETRIKVSGRNCVFVDPDTSIAGIKIRDWRSTISIIGEGHKPDDRGEYHFYTKLDGETLTLVHHPGDYKHEISIFRVEYSDKADHGYKQLSIDRLVTEKEIMLGLNKKQIIEKLGNCYVSVDSADNYIELLYRIELPDDTRTRLLSRHKMPIYHASYKIWNDKLEKFEFGFEYP